MKILCTGDWELTEERLPIAKKIVGAISNEFINGGYDYLVFTGDMFREFTAATATFANEQISLLQIGKKWPLLVVGNHDREVTADRLTALFGGVINTPQVHEIDGVFIGILPAPDRLVFGASRGAEGKRQRDAALSEALEAALISLETRIGPENLSKAILFFHAAIGGAELGTQKLPHGLTWEIPAARLQRWGLAIGGHIHRPQQIGENIYYTGGIAPWTFSDKAERFRVLSIETVDHTVGKSFVIESIPLPGVLIPIELELGHHEEAVWPGTGGGPLTDTLIKHLTIKAGFEMAGGETVNLKIRAKLPPNELDALPKTEELAAALNAHFGNQFINTLNVCREPTGLHKVRISEDAHKMEPADLLDEFIRVTENGADPEVIAKAKLFMEGLDIGEIFGKGKFGYKPVWLRVRNFCQWKLGEIDFRDLEGSISVTGDNNLGKSNLMVKSQEFALFKKTSRKQEQLRDTLRIGATTGNVEEIFWTGNQFYLVRRALELTGKGVNCKSEFFYIAEENIDPYIRGEIADLAPVCENAGDIDSKITELVGSINYFLLTVLGDQDDLNKIKEFTSSDWGKIFIEAIGLDGLDSIRKTAKDNKEALENNAHDNETKINELDGQVTVDEAELEDLPEASVIEDQIESCKSLINDNELTIKKYQGDKDSLVEKKAGLQAKQREEEALRLQRGAVAGRIKGIVIEDLGERPADTEAIDEEALRAEIAELEKSRDTANDQIQKAERDISRKGGEREALEEKIETGRGRYQLREVEIRGLEAKLADLESPPCDGTQSVDGPHEMRDVCPAWRAWTKGDHISELKDLNNKLIDEIDKARIERDKLADERESLAVAKSTDIENLGVYTRHVKEKNEQLGNYQNEVKALELYDSKAASQEGLKKQRGAAKIEFQEITAKLESFGDVIEKIKTVNSKIAAVDEWIEGSKYSIEDQRSKLQGLTKQLYAIANLKSGIENKKAKQAEYREEIRGWSFDVKAWALLELAFHHSGIPYLLMERMIGDFEREANDILSPTGITLQAETVTPTGKGELRDKVKLLYTDHRGQHPIYKSSGMVTAALSLSINSGLAIMGSHFYGHFPELHIHDEVFAAFKDSMHDVVVEIIERIAAKFRLFIFITHKETLASVADNRIQVVADRAGSPRLLIGGVPMETGYAEKVAS